LTTKDSILVVDDHRDSREMLTAYLTLCGFVVHEAADGLEAIDMAIRIHPPIILMDIVMPRLDGWEATRRLKADARTKDLTIIALSAFSLTDERQNARAAGCDDFIPKPCDPGHLADVLRGILNRRSGRGFTPPNLRPEIEVLSLADAIAADMAFDDAIAAAIERRTRRQE
jgi:two-component system, cell cycle response regulator DivK